MCSSDLPVIGWKTAAFPAFWSRDSGLACPLTMDRVDQVARAHRLRAALGIAGGQLVANPIPAAAEIPAGGIAPVIDAAVAQAEAEGVSGKEVTPFLLARVFEATGGRSLEANVALVESNARLAARIALALAREPRP